MKMKEIKEAVLFVAVFLALALPLSAGEDGWKTVINRDGITVENRAVEGFRMKQLRARAVIDAPVEVVYEVLDTADKFNEWFGDCVLQKTVKRISKYEKISYHVVDTPWPLRDRDFIARVTTKPDWKGGKVVSRIDSIGPPEDSGWGMDDLTKKEGRVRMRVMHGVFILRRMDPGRTDFTYMAIGDPGIALPAWMLNLFSTRQPFETIKKLKKQVMKKIYWEKAEKRHGRIFTPQVSQTPTGRKVVGPPLAR